MFSQESYKEFIKKHNELKKALSQAMKQFKKKKADIENSINNLGLLSYHSGVFLFRNKIDGVNLKLEDIKDAYVEMVGSKQIIPAKKKKQKPTIQDDRVATLHLKTDSGRQSININPDKYQEAQSFANLIVSTANDYRANKKTIDQDLLDNKKKLEKKLTQAETDLKVVENDFNDFVAQATPEQLNAAKKDNLIKKAALIVAIIVGIFMIGAAMQPAIKEAQEKKRIAAEKEAIEQKEREAKYAAEQKEHEERQKAENERRKNAIVPEDYRLIIGAIKDSVKKNLKAPSTAKFQGGFFDATEGWDIQPMGRMVKFSSVVDSQNSFGAMIRTSFSATVCKNNNELKVAQFVLDGQVAAGQNFEQCN